MSAYQTTLKDLYQRRSGLRGEFRLQNITRLLARLDNPHRLFPSVHVAGTNGKGSVCRHLAKYWEKEEGKKVGLYTSPHLSSFRERARVNQECIPEDTVVRIVTRLDKIARELDIPASFFEITTAMAFVFFAESQVDLAVIETGLGGRHDATNVLLPRLSVITSISLEHTSVLGDSIEAIAREKGGIIKPGVPVVIGPSVPSKVIEPLARKSSAPLTRITGPFLDFPTENQEIAWEAIRTLSPRAKRHRFAKVASERPPCRFERVMTPEGVSVILDVAHNPAGTKALAALFQSSFPSKRASVVIAISSDKDLDACLSPLVRVGATWFPVEARNGRSYPARVVQEALLRLGVRPDQTLLAPTLQKALEGSLSASISSSAPVLVCGSFFIMGETRSILGVEEPQDAIDLNEKGKHG